MINPESVSSRKEYFSTLAPVIFDQVADEVTIPILSSIDTSRFLSKDGDLDIPKNAFEGGSAFSYSNQFGLEEVSKYTIYQGGFGDQFITPLASKSLFGFISYQSSLSSLSSLHFGTVIENRNISDHAQAARTSWFKGILSQIANTNPGYTQRNFDTSFRYIFSSERDVSKILTASAHPDSGLVRYDLSSDSRLELMESMKGYNRIRSRPNPRLDSSTTGSVGCPVRRTRVVLSQIQEQTLRDNGYLEDKNKWTRTQTLPNGNSVFDLQVAPAIERVLDAWADKLDEVVKYGLDNGFDESKLLPTNLGQFVDLTPAQPSKPTHCPVKNRYPHLDL